MSREIVAGVIGSTRALLGHSSLMYEQPFNALQRVH